MKTSWKRCAEFAAAGQAYLAGTKDKETKLGYAIKRVLSQLQKHQATVNDVLADIEIDCCATDDNGVITRDAQGNLQYTKDGLRDRNKRTREYLSTDNVEIDPYFATELPDDLAEAQIEAFAGFVIPEADELECLSQSSTMMAPDAANGQSESVA